MFASPLGPALLVNGHHFAQFFDVWDLAERFGRYNQRVPSETRTIIRMPHAFTTIAARIERLPQNPAFAVGLVLPENGQSADTGTRDFPRRTHDAHFGAELFRLLGGFAVVGRKYPPFVGQISLADMHKTDSNAAYVKTAMIDEGFVLRRSPIIFFHRETPHLLRNVERGALNFRIAQCLQRVLFTRMRRQLEQSFQNRGFDETFRLNHPRSPVPKFISSRNYNLCFTYVK